MRVQNLRGGGGKEEAVSARPSRKEKYECHAALLLHIAPGAQPAMAADCKDRSNTKREKSTKRSWSEGRRSRGESTNLSRVHVQVREGAYTAPN